MDIRTEKPIIEVRGLGKRYEIAHMRGGYIALRDVIANVARRPFSFLAHKAKQATGLEKKEAFWALRGVDFNVHRGEVVGVIGANGAGKSTLLKILSQITPPTEGEVILRGRVGSLLEVGTGFHPELTGRENIFLNGAILGMKRREIAAKFDQIVEFAGVDKFLDTPVKHYSSGMYVRLAFSVAAHMEPDILLVDEVLAVGDAEFQKKCLGKMDEITRKEGRTILFVSHNLAAIQQLCPKTILLRNGKVTMFSGTKEVIDHYLNDGNKNLNSVMEYRPIPDVEAQITKISILGKDGKPTARIPIKDSFSVEIEYDIRNKLNGVMLSLSFYSGDDMLLNSWEGDQDTELPTYDLGKYKTRVSVPPSLFNVGSYNIEIAIKRHEIKFIDRKQSIAFEIVNGDDPRGAVFHNKFPGKFAVPLEYRTTAV